jgi:hypothetical protein
MRNMLRFRFCLATSKQSKKRSLAQSHPPATSTDRPMPMPVERLRTLLRGMQSVVKCLQFLSFHTSSSAPPSTSTSSSLQAILSSIQATCKDVCDLMDNVVAHSSGSGSGSGQRSDQEKEKVHTLVASAKCCEGAIGVCWGLIVTVVNMGCALPQLMVSASVLYHSSLACVRDVAIVYQDLSVDSNAYLMSI